MGLSSFGIQHSAARPIQLDEAVSDYAKVQAKFQVLEAPRQFGNQGNFRVAVKLLSAEISAQEIGFSARGEIRGGDEIAQVKTGSEYRCLLALRPTAKGDRAGFSGHCKGELQLEREANQVNAIVTGVRVAFLENARGVSQDAKGLVAGLAIGDTSMLSDQLKINMKTVSLTHLTAVSGANCAIVLAMVYLLVRKLGGDRWVRLVVGLATLVAYVLLVGAQPSVLRAGVMAAAVLIAISLGRKTAPLSALALAILVLLIADPWLAVDFGFALSVAATAGLLILTEPIARRLAERMPRWLAISIAVAVAAQIFCLPVLLQLQSGLATYSLPANLIAEPMVAPVTVLGILAVIFAVPFPWLAQLLSFTASLGTAVIAWVANHFSSLPRETMSWPAGLAGTVAATAVILGFVLWLRAEPNRLRSLGITTLTVVSAVSLGFLAFNEVRLATWPMPNWNIVACDVGQGDSMVLKSGNLIAVIDVGKDDKAVDACLTELGVTEIDLLVLTHFDMDHVGGIRGALEGRSVKTVLVSPFKDERWGATGTTKYLAGTAAKIIAVEKGVSGTFGDVTWQVISPLRAASGAEDSNDASVVMLWKSSAFNLLTMADIGERGQMRMSSGESWWQDLSGQSIPLVLKVSHHGSADQYPELIEALNPDLSLISVGKDNSYGHPTRRTLGLLERAGSKIYRTDALGSIAISVKEGGLAIANSPHG